MLFCYCVPTVVSVSLRRRAIVSLKNLFLCINKSKIALSFVDDAKLELKFNPKKKQNQ